jgi:nucleoid DNA-binding protein
MATGRCTIQEIAKVLVTKNGLEQRDASRFATEMFAVIHEQLAQNYQVKVKGLGTFKVITVEARESVSVRTGDRVLIGEHSKITFTPDTTMKELVNKPFSQFETVVLNEGVDFKETKEEEAAEETPVIEEGESEIDEIPLVDFASGDVSDKTQEEISDEDFPEWVIEPMAAPVTSQPIDLGTPAEPETPVEPEMLAEPEMPAEPEIPAEFEAPAEQETPSVAEENEVPVEKTTEEPSEEPAEESVDESSVEDEYVEEEEEEGTIGGGMKWTMVLLACLISLLVGYLLGNYFPWNRQAEPTEAPAPKIEKVKEATPVKKSDAKPVAEPAKQPEEKVEAPAEKSVPSEEKAEKPVAAPVEQSKPEAKPEVQKPVEAPKPPVAQKPSEAPKQQPVATAPAEVKLDKYEAMDSRVRTGAYRIVGLDHKEKVKEGDNLQRITKRTLGPGMECYIEVYNGLNATSQLKTGQEIKIPKVERKKKKMVQN